MIFEVAFSSWLQANFIWYHTRVELRECPQQEKNIFFFKKQMYGRCLKKGLPSDANEKGWDFNLSPPALKKKRSCCKVRFFTFFFILCIFIRTFNFWKRHKTVHNLTFELPFISFFSFVAVYDSIFQWLSG